MKIVINRAVIVYSLVVGILIGMALQQGASARRAYGSYDLDEDSRRAILQGGSGSSSRTRERRVRTRARQTNRAQRQAPVVVPADTGSPSSGESDDSSNSSSLPSGSTTSESTGKTPSANVRPGGLSPLSKIDPPTTYSK